MQLPIVDTFRVDSMVVDGFKAGGEAKLVFTAKIIPRNIKFGIRGGKIMNNMWTFILGEHLPIPIEIEEKDGKPYKIIDMLAKVKYDNGEQVIATNLEDNIIYCDIDTNLYKPGLFELEIKINFENETYIFRTKFIIKQ